jgi:tripartite-type tricarboxylate transporter receptor subunit TctC
MVRRSTNNTTKLGTTKRQILIKTKNNWEGYIMKIRTKSFVISILGAGGLAFLAAGTVSADDFPSKPIQYVLHASAGGGTDTMARLLAPIVSGYLGQKVVVRNMKGGGGAKQMSHITKTAKPDGYTIGSTTGSLIGRMNTVLKGKFAVKDFIWVTGMLSDPFVFAVPADSSAKDLKGLVKMVTSKPGKYKIASYSVGGAQWIAWNIFANGAGFKATDAVWIPYGNVGKAAVATVGGHADFTVNFVGKTLQHVRGGKLRYISLMAPQRSAAIPDVPTISEAGYPKIDSTFVQFRGIVAPLKTPADRIQKINAAFIKAMKTERIKKWLKRGGKSAMNYGPKEFTKFAVHMDKVTAQYVKGLAK